MLKYKNLYRKIEVAISRLKKLSARFQDLETLLSTFLINTETR